MMLMEAYSKLQRENLRLQAKVLRMEDASGKVAQLEELNRKLVRVCTTPLRGCLHITCCVCRPRWRELVSA